MFHRKSLQIALMCLAVFGGLSQAAPAEKLSRPDRVLKRAFQNHRSEFQVRFSGTVDFILTDDLVGDRHQRFVVRLDSGQTILVAHNIDLAPRVKRLREGAGVVIRGEYIWNDKGGIVHFTHKDADGSHPGGWIKFRGKKYW